MYKISKEELEKIIDSSCFSSDIEKNKIIRLALGNLISELTDYTNDLSNSLISNCTASNEKNVISNIQVAFLNYNEDFTNVASVGLYPMADKGNTIFVDEEYDKLKVLIGDVSEKRTFQGQYIKDGETHKFEYYLAFDRSYVEMHELIYKYALYYSIKNPVVFSPYSFKSFSLVYDKEKLKGEKLDFNFKDNGIRANESSAFNLYWNNILTVETKTYDAKEPYGDLVKYIYEFSKSKNGNYLLPLPQNNQTKIYSINFTADSIRIITDRDVDTFYVLESMEVDSSSSIIKKLVSSEKLYSNDHNYKLPINSRIISMADIEHSIVPFRNNFGVKCYISEKPSQIVSRYSRKYKPDRKANCLFNTISRVNLRFSSTEYKQFLTDYINYVLEYLEYFYPEIEWVGEI